ncbi:MAG: HIT family protein [Cyclobacteriaceae bacterium]|jgi:histidine triad (HIT) family protein|nr:HIT family protein [Cyclobacteriaceae bacterium]
MASIFTRIIHREIPGYIVAEDERHIAILDIMPLVMGHVLVIPKHEQDYLFDLTEGALAELMMFAKPIAKALEKVVPCKRIGVSVIGLEVPHVHVHLVPMNSADDVNFTRPKLKPSPLELSLMADKVKTALAAQ